MLINSDNSLLSNIEVVDKFNAIKDKYRRLYFDIYTVLLMYDWRPLNDYIGDDNFDFLVTSGLYDKYISEVDYSYVDVIDLDNVESFEVDIVDCKSVKPPYDYVCSIKDFSNINIEEALKKYSEDKSNYKSEVDSLFISNDWIRIIVEEVEGYEDGQDLFDLDLYISPFMQFNIDDNNEINKYNVQCLLDNCPNLIINTDLWWGFDLVGL